MTGSTPQAIAAELDRLAPINMGASPSYNLLALAKGVYQHCKITSINSGKVLDIEQTSTQDGGKLIQWTFSGTPNQLWRLVPVSPDSYILVSVNSNKVLDVPGGSMEARTQIVQWTYNGGSNQHWRLIEIGKNDYKIESVLSGKALDVEGASTANGANILQDNYGGRPNQRWRIDGV